MSDVAREVAPPIAGGNRAAPSRARSMLPAEHGAYAQLGLPLVTALAVSRGTPSSFFYAMAACAAFVAHEPLLVLLGHRGTRARRESGRVARRYLAGATVAAVALGVIAFASSPASRAWALLPAVLAAASLSFALRRQERSLAGEGIACCALASAAVPTAIAGALPWQDAIAIWGVFCAAFLVSTIEVRTVAHRRTSSLARIATWGAALFVIGALGATRPLLAAAPFPVLAVVAYVVLRAPAATALRRLGWALATSSLLTAVAVFIALRV